MKCLSIFFIFLIIAEMCGSMDKSYTREVFIGTEWRGPDGATLQFISRDSVTFRNVNWDSIYNGWEPTKKIPSSGVYPWGLNRMSHGETKINIYFPELNFDIDLNLRQYWWETEIYEYIGDPDLMNLYIFEKIDYDEQKTQSVVSTTQNGEQNGSADGGTFTVSDGKGGSVTTIAQGSGINEKDVLVAVVHETMHHAQILHGQGGRFIVNEVEAVTFQSVVGYNAFQNKDQNAYIPTSMNDAFGIAKINLGLDGYSVSQFIEGVKTFKNSWYNNTGMYNSYKSYFPLSWKPLLKLYNIKSQ